MKKSLYIVIISFFLFACNNNSYNSSESDQNLTKEQQEFAQIVKNEYPAPIVEWRDGYILDIGYDSKDLEKQEGNDQHKINALIIAREISKRGLKYTGKTTCVIIYNYPITEELARYCDEKKEP